jgi:plasmid stability protein
MGRHKHKRQVVVYLGDDVVKSLKLRAAREGTSMSALVE